MRCFRIYINRGSNWCLWVQIPYRPEFIFRPYFHYCLSSVRYCEDRFHIYLSNRILHKWFSCIHSQSNPFDTDIASTDCSISIGKVDVSLKSTRWRLFCCFTNSLQASTSIIIQHWDRSLWKEWHEVQCYVAPRNFILNFVWNIKKKNVLYSSKAPSTRIWIFFNRKLFVAVLPSVHVYPVNTDDISYLKTLPRVDFSQNPHWIQPRVNGRILIFLETLT